FDADESGDAMTEIAGVTKPSPLSGALRSLVRAHVSSSGRTATPRSVARELSRLGSDWRVLDDIPAGRRGRLEHLVIGPGGVFAVTARHEARDTICLGAESVLVGDVRIHHGRISRDDAAEISGRLSDSVGYAIPVTALVLIVGDRRFVVPAQHDDAVVRVTTPASAVRFMRRRRTVWTEYAIERIYAAAYEPSTWGSSRTTPGAEPESSRAQSHGQSLDQTHGSGQAR
ncbi:MAG TPA: nuclease-related domain-containing protein, partial [Nocardioidaceae bacterium]|nr:nuclease-related domain-containing protein [Nocardioidaceae bacterium]